MATIAGRSEKREMARKPRRAARTQTHACATTTPRVRRAIQASEEKNLVLAKRYGVNRKTIAKWKAREFTSDERMGPKTRRSSLLSYKDEAIILAYRWRTRLPLDDAYSRLRRQIPKLSRSGLYRCLKRHGLGRIGPTARCPPLTTGALRGPFIFEITVRNVVFRDPDHVLGVVYQVFLAIEEITKDVYAEVANPTPENAAGFLGRLADHFPQRVIGVATDNGPPFTDGMGTWDESIARISYHPFAIACQSRGIAHNRSIPPHTKPPEIRSPAVEIR
jgi:hypothetical protein